MNKYTAQEQAYKNGYELGKKAKQEKFAEQFIKGFNEALKVADLEGAEICKNCVKEREQK